MSRHTKLPSDSARPWAKPQTPGTQPRTPPHGPAGAAVQRRAAPAPPPVYRPQPTPKVLQTKSAVVPPAQRPQATAATRPNLPPRPTPPERPAARPAPAPAQAPKAAANARSVQRKATPGAAVVQAVKIYPNLHPGAVERVEPGNLFRLESFTDQYRMRKAESHGVYVPNQQYNFVRTVEGQTLLHNRYRHPSIAEGRQVLYAGEVHFNNGRLQWWSNGSGHYQPDADDAAQAGLPMDSFYTYQQVIKGEHKRKKS